MNKFSPLAKASLVFASLALAGVLGGTVSYSVNTLAEVAAKDVAVQHVHEARKAAAQEEHDWKQARFEERLAEVEAKHLARLGQ